MTLALNFFPCRRARLKRMIFFAANKPGSERIKRAVSHSAACIPDEVASDTGRGRLMQRWCGSERGRENSIRATPTPRNNNNIVERAASYSSDPPRHRRCFLRRVSRFFAPKPTHPPTMMPSQRALP